MAYLLDDLTYHTPAGHLGASRNHSIGLNIDTPLTFNFTVRQATEGTVFHVADGVGFRGRSHALHMLRNGQVEGRSFFIRVVREFAVEAGSWTHGRER